MIKKESSRDKIVFIIVLLFMVSLMFRLFYYQAISNDGRFLSDIKPYIEEVKGVNETFDFPYPVLFKTAKLIDVLPVSTEVAMAITLTLFNGIAIFLTRLFFLKKTEDSLLSTIGTCALFFVSMIFTREISRNYLGHLYYGVFSPNPWQNGTYMAARPFMIVAFVYGVETLYLYESELKGGINQVPREFWIFSIGLLLSTMAKPSYTLVHLSCTGLVMLVQLIKSRFESIKEALKYCIFIVPTLVDLLYQYSGVFRGVNIDGEEKGIAISLFRVWNIYTPSIPLSLLLAGLFPIFVLLTHVSMLRKCKEYLFSWLIYLSGFVSSSIFYEKGFREPDFNFGWGYICGLFFVFFTSILVVINDLKNYKENKNKILIVVLEVIFLLLHVAMGILYFTHLSLGGYYD